MRSQFTDKIQDGNGRALAAANEIKIRRIFEEDWIPDDLAHIRQMIDMYEFSITEKWKSLKSRDKNEKLEFQTLCMNCFTLLQALKVPAEPIPKILYALKVFTYGYLGEKGESVSRLLSSDKFKVAESTEWNVRVFTAIYRGILHMVQKNSRQDLQSAIILIRQLRGEQSEYEKTYLDASQKGTAYELASLYHLSKATELASTYMLQGTPPQIETQLDIHFDAAISFAQKCGLMELDLLLHMLHVAFKKMVTNSIWFEARRVPPIQKLMKSLADMPKPVFELMYPQRVAIQNGLLDQSNYMMVVTLPTSSGKTMIAEFKILQLWQPGSGSWIAYVAPTRALVNQIASGLRRDFESLGIRVEKMSGALEQDKFEDDLMNSRDFDVLVTTPEKLNLLLRQNSPYVQSGFCGTLALAVIDEAHNLGSSNRGLALEMLISIIKNDCANANLLLLTPEMPDADKIASWLDPEHSKSISMQLEWAPNDSVVGAFYPEGSRRNVSTYFKPVLYSDSNLEMAGILLGNDSNPKHTFSKIKETKYLLTSYAAHYMQKRGSVLVVTSTVDSSWKTAHVISDLTGQSEQDPDIELAKKFVRAELGDGFELATYLDHRVGVHNAGLPADILRLMEWLMEKGKLKVLVSTTTIAQGINFPASSVLLSSYYQPGSPDATRQGTQKMSSIDYLNLAGRVGRTHQSMGLVGIATDGTVEALEDLKGFLNRNVREIVSSLYSLCSHVTEQERHLDLSAHANEPEWSNFIQYLAHMYNQSSGLDDFILRSEIILRNTYGYVQMDPQAQGRLLEAVKEYGRELDDNRDTSAMSDQTGFSPRTIESVAEKIRDQDIVLDLSLFSGNSETLTKIINIMRNDMPELDLTDPSHSHRISDADLNRIISEWVSGNEIYKISEKYFGGTGTGSVQDCITTIYKKIVNYATWGLSATEKIMDGKSNIPAMVYYGVNSDGAILMSMNGVPRRIAEKLGRTYSEGNESLYGARSRDVLGWLQKQEASVWDRASDGALTGAEYKRIWQINEGLS